jgi:hypothetical protein
MRLSSLLFVYVLLGVHMGHAEQDENQLDVRKYTSACSTLEHRLTFVSFVTP